MYEEELPISHRDLITSAKSQKLDTPKISSSTIADSLWLLFGNCCGSFYANRVAKKY